MLLLEVEKNVKQVQRISVLEREKDLFSVKAPEIGSETKVKEAENVGEKVEWGSHWSLQAELKELQHCSNLVQDSLIKPTTNMADMVRPPPWFSRIV